MFSQMFPEGEGKVDLQPLGRKVDSDLQSLEFSSLSSVQLSDTDSPSEFSSSASIGEPLHALQVHDVVQRIVPSCRKNLPSECLEVELGVRHQAGDTYLVTYPKTGTTVLQYMCHLLRTRGEGTDFESIHQVCPNTTSAYLIGIDLNKEQVAYPRLFKSHRQIEQVAPFSTGVRFISTIRNPIATLISCYRFRMERGELKPDMTIEEYAFSDYWTKQFYQGDDGVATVYDHILTFWRARKAKNFLLLPFEDFTEDRSSYISKIAQFLCLEADEDLIAKVSELTSKESMISRVHQFDGSWDIAQRAALGRPHPSITSAAAKVTTSSACSLPSVLANKDIMALNDKLWAEKVKPITGCNSYEELKASLKLLQVK